jgi:molybdate-binding protein
VPLARERYDLIFRPEDRRRLRDLLSLLGAADFGAVVAALGGYYTSLCGSEMQL